MEVWSGLTTKPTWYLGSNISHLLSWVEALIRMLVHLKKQPWGIIFTNSSTDLNQSKPTLGFKITHSQSAIQSYRTLPKWRTQGATGEVWAGGAHRWAPSGDCPPAWLSGWRSLASVRRGPRYAAATAASPGWRKGRRRTGRSRLHAGTSRQRWKAVLDKNLTLVWRQPALASLILGCKAPRQSENCCLGRYTGLLSFIYSSCPDPSLPPCYLHPMSSLLFVSV